MKYPKEAYVDCGYWGADDDGVIYISSKLVKTRREHTCISFNTPYLHTIPSGTYALRDTAIVDDCMNSCYTCTDCIDIWLDEVKYERKA